MYTSNLFWPLTLVFVGFIIFAVNVGMLPEGIWRFWPVILIFIGLIGIVGYMDATKPSAGSIRSSSSKLTKKAPKKSRRR